MMNVHYKQNEIASTESVYAKYVGQLLWAIHVLCFVLSVKNNVRKSKKRIYNQRKPNRPLGSIDICENCGKEYVVKSGLQKYCPDCSDLAIKKNISKRKNTYYHENKEQINRYKEEMRSNGYVCVICGKVFDKDVTSVTCSPECQKEHERIQQNKADIKAGKRKLPAEERYKS